MAEVANTAWYRLGTVSVTNGSTKVTGKDTKFLTAGINPGAALRLDAKGDFASEIARVVSDTELELARPYYGGTASNQTYSIDRNHQSTLLATLAARLAGLAGKWETRYDLDMETITGKSAYEVAVENGYTGTVTQWLESLKGAGDYAELLAKVEPLTYNNAGTHNLPRGKNLGSVFTDEQSAAIRAGTFKDIHVVDYWNFTNVPYTYYGETSDTTAQAGKTYYADATGTELETQPETGTDISEAGYFVKINATYTGTMRVADLDHFYIISNRLLRHHAVVLPDHSLGQSPMNKTATTQGGYAGSYMRTVRLKRAEAIFRACFGEDHVMQHDEQLSNAVSGGQVSGSAKYRSYCELMDEQMAFGSHIYDSSSPDGSVFYNLKRSYASNRQFNLFRHRPEFLFFLDQFCWLRTIASNNQFSALGIDGLCVISFANDTVFGIRPYALIY